MHFIYRSLSARRRGEENRGEMRRGKWERERERDVFFNGIGDEGDRGSGCNMIYYVYYTRLKGITSLYFSPLFLLSFFPSFLFRSHSFLPSFFFFPFLLCSHCFFLLLFYFLFLSLFFCHQAQRRKTSALGCCSRRYTREVCACTACIERNTLEDRSFSGLVKPEESGWETAV